MYFRSFYCCPDCSHEWLDDCSEQISGDCPQCGRVALSPLDTEEIVPDAEEETWEPAGYPRPPVDIPPIAYDHFSRVVEAVFPPLPAGTQVVIASPAKTAVPESDVERQRVAKSEMFEGYTSTQLDLFGQHEEASGHPPRK